MEPIRMKHNKSQIKDDNNNSHMDCPTKNLY